MKKLNIIGGITLTMILLVVVSIVYFSPTEKVELKEPNYVGLVKLGLAPNSNPRQPTSKDINTGVRLTSQDGKIYELYESRTWNSLDYGKTFVARIA